MSGERGAGLGAGTTDLRLALRRLPDAGVLLECRAPLDPALVEHVAERLSAIAGRPVAVRQKVSPRAPGATILVGEDVRIDLDSTRRLLERLERDLGDLRTAEVTTVEQTARRVAGVIDGAAAAVQVEGVAGRGTVLQVGDGVALVDGLASATSQEVVRFESGVEGIAFSLFEHAVGCLLLGSEERIGEGSAVERTGHPLRVPVGAELLGRVVDPLGRPLDGKGPVRTSTTSPIERLAPGVVQRRPVCESLHTGIKILDALVPLGRGQRELVLGDRKIGKTTAAIDVLLSQRGQDVICVYAAIGQKASTVATLVKLLEERGALEYTVVVVAFSGDPPAFRHVAPYAACTMAEWFMDRGRHALIVYDDLSKHAVTYREISALLKRPIGREAYPGDVFFVHSRLLERAARIRDDLGGGSLTAIPIVETLAGDLSAFIPTNVISICDGQIVLDAGLFNEGFRPAMHAGLSVSRVGGMAQTAAMRKVAGRLRIDLAQHGEMARFVRFGAEVDASTLRQLTRGERELELLKQDAHTPMPLEKEIVTLFAAVNGYADDVPVERLRPFERELHAFMELRHPEVLAGIRDSKDLSRDLEERLRAALAGFHDSFAAAPAAERAGV
jgi:F-type H+-transporting ATPase subunit alpha